MDAIDFSAKHDVMIRHKDGTLIPMDEPYYEVTQIDEETWMIMSSGDYHYLITGDVCGVAIDTGYGAGNLREFLEGLCKKPVPWVINTHCHFDHSANNCYFDLAYMSERAKELVSIPYKSFEGIQFPRDYDKKAVGDGNIIELSGRPLEVFEIGDHTPDGIALLDRTHRMLFTGDEFMFGMKSLNGSVEDWNTNLKKLMAHRDEFDSVCGGQGVTDAGIVDVFYEASMRILEGKGTDGTDPDSLPSMPPMELSMPPKPGEIKVYDCHFPHFEDIPHKGFDDEDSNLETIYCKGLRFTYDRTKVKNKG